MRKVEELTAAGRMRPSGLAEVEAAKADGRWDAAYESQQDATVPPDLAAALAASPRAAQAFEALGKTDQYAVILDVVTARTPETRVGPPPQGHRCAGIMTEVADVVAAIERVRGELGRVVVGVSGYAGAGKSVLARQLVDASTTRSVCAATTSSTRPRAPAFADWDGVERRPDALRGPRAVPRRPRRRASDRSTGTPGSWANPLPSPTHPCWSSTRSASSIPTSSPGST